MRLLSHMGIYMTKQVCKKPKKSECKNLRAEQEVKVASEEQVKKLFEKAMKQFPRTIRSLAKR